MIIESMHINQIDKGCGVINHNDKDGNDENDNDNDEDENSNGKVENISNAEAARIMKSKLGKASSHGTEVSIQDFFTFLAEKYVKRIPDFQHPSQVAASQPSTCIGQENKEGGSGLDFAHPPAAPGGVGVGVGGVGNNHLHQGNALLLPPPPLIPVALKEERSDGGKKQKEEKEPCLVNQQEAVMPVAEEKEGKEEEDVLLVVDETLDGEVEEKIVSEKK